MAEHRDRNIIIVGQNQSQPRNHHRRFFSNLRFDWKTILGIFGTTLGIAGGLITVINFVTERANLVISSPQVELQPIIPIETHKNSLENLEEEYREYTNYEIIELRDELDNLDVTSPKLEQDTQELIELFDKNIAELKAHKPSETYPEIINKLKLIKSEFITTSQLEVNDVNSISQSLSEIERDYTDYTESKIIDLQEQLNGVNLSSDNQELEQDTKRIFNSIEETINYFENLFQQTQEEQRQKEENYANIIEELEKIKSSLKKDLEENKKVFVELAIENRSRLKNLIHGKAMITFYDSSNRGVAKEVPSLPITLRVVTEPTIIDDFGLKSIQLESKSLNALDDNIRKSILTAFESNYSYVIVVEDLHDKIWHKGGRISTGFSIQPEDEKRLENESIRIINKLHSQ